MQNPFVNIAIEAARAAGVIIIQGLDRPEARKPVEKKPNDFVTRTDQKAEKKIISVIRKAYPTHAILGEENGELAGQDYQWIIDPLDGTRNFIHGFPHFAISIALAHKGKIQHGVIYDPLRQELFTASRGKGAMLNGRRIRVGLRKHLSECLIGTGFAYRLNDTESTIPYQVFQTILPLCGDIRRAGSASLDLAYVACGRLDAFWEFGLQIWDFAAGILLIKEAGGLICDPYGEETYQQTGHIAAANPTIMRQLLKTMRPALKEQ